MKPFKVVVQSLVLSSLLLGGFATFLQCRNYIESVTGAGDTAKCETAQRQTVLVATVHGSGSGFVVLRKNIDGKTRVFVWTAAHVVEGVDTATVRLTFRNESHKAGLAVFNARVVYRTPGVDAALIQVDAPPSFFVNTEFDFSVPRVGTPIYHVGNLFGDNFDGSFTTGVLSQVGVQIAGWPWRLLDQTTSLAVPGSSGGPIFNGRNRKVLGILVGGPGVPGISCYIPVRELQSAVNPDMDWMFKDKMCPSDRLLDAIVNTTKLLKIVTALTGETESRTR